MAYYLKKCSRIRIRLLGGDVPDAVIRGKQRSVIEIMAADALIVQKGNIHPSRNKLFITISKRSFQQQLMAISRIGRN